jgi:hypothetical protein
MAPFDALYGRRCLTPLNWSEAGERTLFGPDLVKDAEERVQVIRENLKMAQMRQKSYHDKGTTPRHFEVGDYVYLKVSPTKGVQRFGVKGKLAPRYIGPYEVIEVCGPVAYRMQLPKRFSAVHNVFHVTQLKSVELDSHLSLGPDDNLSRSGCGTCACTGLDLCNNTLIYLPSIWKERK